MRRIAPIFAGLALAAVVAATVASAIVLDATAAEVRDLALIFGLAAVGALGVSFALVRLLAQRLRRVGHTLVLAAVAGAAVALAATYAASRQMFLSYHDLALNAVVVSFSAVLGSLVAVAFSRPMAHDIRRVAEVADRIAAGDVDVRVGVLRSDELGDLAAAVDRMAAALAAMGAARAATERERRALLAAVSHDLRTPLAALQAAVEALADGVVDDPGTVATYYDAMSRQVAALDVLIDDLFRLARIEAGDVDTQREQVDLAELVEDALAALAPAAAARGVSLVRDGPASLVLVASAEAIARVLRNLLDNAVRHARSRVEVRFVRDRGGVTLTVADDGEGIAPELREQVFAAFTTGDPSRNRAHGGAGLGLAIVRGLVTAHGGDVAVAESSPLGGAALRVTLPA